MNLLDKLKKSASFDYKGVAIKVSDKFTEKESLNIIVITMLLFLLIAISFIATSIYGFKKKEQAMKEQTTITIKKE